MALSQPLNLGDRLREALAEARSVLENYQLQGKITLVPEIAGGGPGGMAGVESSMDRTARDAKDAAQQSIGGGSEASGPLNPTDRMVDAMTKLVRALEGAGGGLGRGRGRRTSAGQAGSSPLDDEEERGPGYVNPYLLQGLIQNPVGTTQNTLMSMLMGGAGAGVKAPGWLMNMLAGSGGTFAPGAALASETGLAASGAAGTYASAGMIGAAKVAVPVAAFAGTMMLQVGAAKDRLQDATDWTEDKRMSQGAGFNWRAGAWDNQFTSRQGIWQKDVRDIVGSSGIGFGGMRQAVGDRGVVDSLNEGAETALRMGISSSQMGSVIGAGVRSGSVSLQGGDAVSQMNRYLGLIETWTSKTAAFGFSSNESLQKLAEISQKGMAGTNVLTRDAQVSLLSMDERIRGRLSPELQRAGGDATSAALGADAAGDTQRVLMMNQFLGADGELNAEGEATALKAFGPQQLATMKRQWGKMAGTAIAHQLSQTDLGRKRARVGLYRGMNAAGAGGPQAMLALNSQSSFLDAAMAADASSDASILNDDATMRSGLGLRRDVVGGGVDANMEQELAQLGQVVQRLSGLTSDTALSMTKLGIASTQLTREFVSLLDSVRQGKSEAGNNPALMAVSPVLAGVLRAVGR